MTTTEATMRKTPKPAPVDAGERYACLVDNGGGENLFSSVQDVGDFGCEVGSREEAAAAARNHPRGAKVVRVLDDGAHEATVAAAVMAERERVFADVRKRVTDSANVMRDIALKSPGSTDAHRARQLGKVDGLIMAVGCVDEAAKVTP